MKNYPALSSNEFHYTFSTAPFLFIGALHLIINSNEQKKKILWILLSSSLSMSAVFTGIMGNNIKGGFTNFGELPIKPQPNAIQEINQLQKIIPREAAVAAEENLIPHFSNRERAYTIVFWPPNKLPTTLENYPPDFIILHKENKSQYKGYQSSETKSFRILRKTPQ